LMGPGCGRSICCNEVLKRFRWAGNRRNGRAGLRKMLVDARFL
jgi:hypothetical protein